MSKSLKLFGGSALVTTIVLTAAYNFADRNITSLPRETVRMDAAADRDFQLIASAVAATASSDGPFGIGRPALEEEIAAWDLDVSPDGTGLPPGSGSVADGEQLFSEGCAVCHGEFAEGVGNWPKLAGGDDTLADDDPVKTVGSYWPYLSTAWDYVHRSMPFGNAQTLTHDEVYSIVAYILYSNFLVDDDFVLSNENFLEVEMPNADGFIVDDRPETEYGKFSGEPCMENCKDTVEITMRAAVLDVTPEEDEPAEDTTVDEASAEPDALEATDSGATDAVEMASADPALVEEGAKVFRKCQACHAVGDGAANKTGPHLNGILGRTIGGLEGYRYSNGFDAEAAEGTVWNAERLAAFLEDPKGYIKGTKMAFRGLPKEDDIAAVSAYLSTFAE